MRLLVDIDGVLADFYKGFSKYLNKNFNCCLNPEDDPISYSFDAWGSGTEDVDMEMAVLGWIANDGYRNIPCYPGAPSFVKWLEEKFDVYIVTARVGDWTQKFSNKIEDKIKSDTYYWLRKNNVITKNIYFCKDKVDFCKSVGISFLIEDKLETALNASKEGLQTVLVDHAYNRTVSERLRIYRVKDLKEARYYLEKLCPIYY